MKYDLFYYKLLSIYNIKLVGTNFISSSISWLIDAKYRKYSTLNSWLHKQLINPSKSLKTLALSLTNSERDDDKTVVNIVKWVKNNVKYKADPYEEWKGAYQTFIDKYGDCDDMNCLVYILCRLAGVHQFKLFCGIGEMDLGGHFFPLYYSTKELKLVTLDTTYYPNNISVKKRQEFNDLEYHKNIWYMFNEDICIKPL